MPIELKITVKDEEKRKLSREFLIYEDITLHENDPIISRYVKEVSEEFKGTPDEIQLRATMVIT